MGCYGIGVMSSSALWNNIAFFANKETVRGISLRLGLTSEELAHFDAHLIPVNVMMKEIA